MPYFSYSDGVDLVKLKQQDRELGIISFPKLGADLSVFIPHWITNLVSWLLFLVLLRKSRTHPKGHCQGCGHDLRFNESGRCPECNAAVVVDVVD